MNKNEKNKRKAYNIKIIFLGEAGVGKTSLINAYLGNAFNTQIMTSCSPKQSNKTIKLDNIKLNLIYGILWVKKNIVHFKNLLSKIVILLFWFMI